MPFLFGGKSDLLRVLHFLIIYSVTEEFLCLFIQIIDAVLKECRKENPTYKMAALKCFGEVVLEYSLDKFQDISDLLFPIIDPVSDT